MKSLVDDVFTRLFLYNSKRADSVLLSLFNTGAKYRLTDGKGLKTVKRLVVQH